MLQDVTRPKKSGGQFNQFWKKDAGIPDEAEFKAISQRADKLRTEIDSSTVTLFPIRVGAKANVAGDGRLG